MPESDKKLNLLDPTVLQQEARGLLKTAAENVASPSQLEDALRKAFRRVVADIDGIEQRAAAGEEIDYRAILGDLLHEKIAAILFLARFTLLDMANCPGESLDVEYARVDLATFAETLFRVDAVEGLGVLYDISADSSGLSAEMAHFWDVVARRSLFLMALLPSCRPWVIEFIAAREHAQLRLEHIAKSQPQYVNTLMSLLEASRDVDSSMVAPESAPYLKIYLRYPLDLPYETARGVCALIFAEHRFQKSLNKGDMGAVIRWFLEGSPAVVGNFLHYTKSKLTPELYIELLGKCFLPRRADARRLAALLLELEAINIASQQEGGLPAINEVLVEAAMTDIDKRLGVARLAVRSLATVANLLALLYVAENAPLLPVAEEAVLAMGTCRRLTSVEPVIEQRPELLPAYRRAHNKLLEIQNLVDEIWTTEQPEMVAKLVRRLEQLEAKPELEKIRKLAERAHSTLGSKFAAKG